MGRADELAATIDAKAATLEARTLVRNPRSTVEPPRAESDERTRRALAAWQALASGPTSSGRLTVERTLGEGGMGVVRLAEQISLGRKVAVKTLRDNARDRESMLKLLREAWITGALEHPNVVPVYDVGVDAHGGPQIVLKRIEGVAWSEVAHESDLIAKKFTAADPLEWNLRIFTQVCRAIHFAHARGVVHRDLKPDNVMIGGFGEVYVLDWGIAVALSDDGTGRFPLAADANDMAGTPVYMAPEMLGGEPERIGPGTDVYLLGATLYEIVTGRAPHDAPSMQAIVASIILSEPELPDGTPDELVNIIRRAMAREVEDRYASADELRTAIEGYLRHRGSMRLVDEAAQSLVRLREEIAGGPQRRVLYNLLGECRFGYRAALVECGDNEQARVGQRAAVLEVARWELGQGDADSAALLLDELDEVPSELRERLDEVRRAKAAEAERVERLARIERDLDKETGARTRTFIASVLGAIWIVAPLIRHYNKGPFYRSHQATIGVDILQILVVVGLGIWARESMTKTAINRRLFAALLFTFVAQAALGVGIWMAGASPELTHWLHLFLWSVMLANLAINLERALWPSALATTALFLATANQPSWLHLGMALVDALIVVNVVKVWAPKQWRDRAREIADNHLHHR
jgi:serine/threonine-protein kinase